MLFRSTSDYSEFLYCYRPEAPLRLRQRTHQRPFNIRLGIDNGLITLISNVEGDLYHYRFYALNLVSGFRADRSAFVFVIKNVSMNE